jgi:tRNA-splicing endonuclease subunit Sen2
MLNYVVYHHYRSLGWVVRGGAKFSCDFMLYNRGPVFSHAEFAIIILPSYTDAYWSGDVFLQNYVKKKEHRTWAWMHCINRVITQAKKSLVLVYVEIPKPPGEGDGALGVDGLLKRYHVREFVMKRWQLNRERGSGK